MSKLTTKTPEQCQWLRSGVFIINFEHISHLALVLLFFFIFIFFIVNFEHVIGNWVSS